jgi:hypothetical protein
MLIIKKRITYYKENGCTRMNKVLVLLGFIILVFGLWTGVYGMLITRPNAGIPSEIFIGVLAGTIGAFILIVGIGQNHVPMLT